MHYTLLAHQSPKSCTADQRYRRDAVHACRIACMALASIVLTRRCSAISHRAAHCALHAFHALSSRNCLPQAAVDLSLQLNLSSGGSQRDTIMMHEYDASPAPTSSLLNGRLLAAEKPKPARSDMARRCSLRSHSNTTWPCRHD